MVEFFNRQRTMMSAVYPILAVFVLHALAEVVVSATPMRFGEVTWRFGATGLLIGSMPAVALGTGMMLWLAGLLDHRSGARWLGIWAILFAIVVAISVVSFGLDALQVRRMIREDAKPGFDDASLKSLMVAVLFVPAMLWIGWRGIGFGKGIADRKEDGPPIVVGG